ncbi:lipase family protein [Janthinobacterium sp. MDB2-8]|uniref:lipase family protein n=1 Tax=Janthinobacterium sp. MDB2-8 TaxID=1259338 RepID=UPI003F222891
MSANFDVFQQTFALSLLSNLASDYIAKERYIPGTHGDPLEAQLATNIQATLPLPVVTAGLGDGWQIVWGPAVWRGAESRVAQNAALVFYNPAVTFEDGTTAPTHVVAISATNLISGYDWIVEDFTVSSTVNWTQYHPAVPSATVVSHDALMPVISKGTATGVAHIAALTPTDPAHGKTSLSAFIRQLNGTVNEGARIVFTGHSLAGALAPTFALYLKEHGALSAFERVQVYPTAGASPGNGSFSRRFAHAFPRKAAGEKPWQSWNSLIRNQYDIVPHAWSLSTLLQLLTIYGNSDAEGGVKLPEQIYGVVLAALADSAASKTLYAALPSAQFSGASPGSAPATAAAYLTMAGNQHVKAYISEILGADFPAVGHGPTVPGVIEFNDATQRIAAIVKILEKILHPGAGG